MTTFGILVPVAKSGIHIKEKNRGKFTVSAEAAGESVLEHATNVLNDPNATPLQKKRAQFAKNAKKFKHEGGAKIHKVEGHRSILDNGWIPTKLLKKVSKHQSGDKINRVRWKELYKSPEYKQFGWKMYPDNMKVIEDSLIARKAAFPLRMAILSQVVAENGGGTGPHSDPDAQGLIGWRGPRAVNLPKTLSGQTHKLMEETFGVYTPDAWYHGGKGTNVASGREMQQVFLKSPNVLQATKAFMKGSVRPPEDQHEKRLLFVELLRKFAR